MHFIWTLSKKRLAVLFKASKELPQIDSRFRFKTFQAWTEGKPKAKQMSLLRQLTYEGERNFLSHLLHGVDPLHGQDIVAIIKSCIERNVFPNSKDMPNPYENILTSEKLTIDQKINLFEVLLKKRISLTDGTNGFSLSSQAITLMHPEGSLYSENDRFKLAHFFVSQGDVPVDPDCENPFGLLLDCQLSGRHATELAQLIYHLTGNLYLQNHSDYADFGSHQDAYVIPDPLFSPSGELLPGWDLSKIKRPKNKLIVLAEIESYMKRPERIRDSMIALDHLFQERLSPRFSDDSCPIPIATLPSFDTKGSTFVLPIPDVGERDLSERDRFTLDETQRVILELLDEIGLGLVVFSGFVQPDSAEKALSFKMGRGTLFRENGLDTQAPSHGIWLHVEFFLAMFLDPGVQTHMAQAKVTHAEVVECYVKIFNSRGSLWLGSIDNHLVDTRLGVPSPWATPDIMNFLVMENAEIFPTLARVNYESYRLAVQQISCQLEQSPFKTVLALALAKQNFAGYGLLKVPDPPESPSRTFPETSDHFLIHSGVYKVILPPADEPMEEDVEIEIVAVAPRKPPKRKGVYEERQVKRGKTIK